VKVKKIDLQRKVVTESDRIAAGNRQDFERMGAYVINMVSSPGSGKTSLIEATVKALKDDVSIFVITGDLMTDNDAARVGRHGVEVSQVTTGEACHLDARMIARKLEEWRSREYDLVMIENVGNLVCPASFDLGEDIKVLLISVTEGDDKPIKYPPMVRASGALVISKTDLLPYVDGDPDTIEANALKIQPDIKTFRISCKTGEGIDQWIGWLRSQLETKRRIRDRS